MAGRTAHALFWLVVVAALLVAAGFRGFGVPWWPLAASAPAGFMLGHALFEWHDARRSRGQVNR